MWPAWPGLPGDGGVTVYSTELHPTRRRASDAPGYWLHAASGGRSHPDCSWIITAHQNWKATSTYFWCVTNHHQKSLFTGAHNLTNEKWRNRSCCLSWPAWWCPGTAPCTSGQSWSPSRGERICPAAPPASAVHPTNYLASVTTNILVTDCLKKASCNKTTTRSEKVVTKYTIRSIVCEASCHLVTWSLGPLSHSVTRSLSHSVT